VVIFGGSEFKDTLILSRFEYGNMQGSQAGYFKLCCDRVWGSHDARTPGLRDTGEAWILDR